MRIMVNFMERPETWLVHCLADDAKTPISPHMRVAGRETLIRLLRYVGADDAAIEEVQTDIRRWSRGSVHITLAPGRKNLLKLRKPWGDGLV